jgi:glycosyltransferase involved in cell wall biosynthesis
VLPSYYEGNPTVLFESLACGIPFIGSKNGGMHEIISSDDYGFILNDPNNYIELAKLLNITLNKKWNYKKIIKYSKNFSASNIAKKILKIYMEL